MARNVTIQKIAEQAGVSVATVDRVMNRRPGVNPKTVKEVNNVLSQLGENLPRRGRPKLREDYRFAFVLPSERTSFIDQVDRVIAQSASIFRHQHITEVTHRFDMSNVDKFVQDMAGLSNVDAIAVMAPDSPAVRIAINEKIRAGFSVLTLFSDVPGSHRSAYIGADNRMSGRTAALLLGNSMPRTNKANCLLVAPVQRYDFQQNRINGFMQVMQDKYPNVELFPLLNVPETQLEAQEHCMKAFPELLKQHSFHSIYISSSSTYGITRAIEDSGFDRNCVIAAHDMTESNKSLLLSGMLDYVFYQDVHYVIQTTAKIMINLIEGVRGALMITNPPTQIATVENIG